MGRKSRQRVEGLAEKLFLIREKLELSQNELVSLKGFETITNRSVISAYERGEREPPVPILLVYARLANICLDILIDPELKLPAKLPSPEKINC